MSGMGLLQTMRMLTVCGVLTTVAWSAELAASDEPPQMPGAKARTEQGNQVTKAPPKVNPGPSANELETWRQAIVHTKRPTESLFYRKIPRHGLDRSAMHEAAEHAVFAG